MNFDEIYEKCSMIKINEQEEGKIFEVNLIKQITTKFGTNLILYNKKYNVCFYSNALLKSYLTKVMSNLKSNGSYYYKDDQLSKLIKFQIKKIGKDKRGMIKVDLDFIKDTKNIQQENKVIPLSDDER